MSRYDEREPRNQRRGEGDEKELATKTLQIQTKRFYFDVKENRRGRFITIAEVEVGGRKSRIVISMSTLPDFQNQLKEFLDIPTTLDASEETPQDGNIKSLVIVKDNRRYYLDLKENQRGRFLRISMATMISNQRSQIALPAEGIKEFNATVEEIMNEFCLNDIGKSKYEAQAMRSESKMFYFDVGENRIGSYLRISEVRPNFRAAISIPEHSWDKFVDVFSKFVEASKLQNPETKSVKSEIQ